MPITIIVILVIAIAVLLVVRSKQGQDKAPAKKTTTSNNKKVAKTPSKNTAPTKATSTLTRSETPAKAKVDLDNLLAKLDLLIADREYAKAEGLINLSLNQDPNLPELYFKLLKLYQLQNDDFAIKQLFDTVQKLNLNEVYQQLYSEQELSKQKEQPLVHKSVPNAASSDVIEFVSPNIPKASEPSIDNTKHVSQPVERNTHIEQNNTVEFDSLAFTPTSHDTVPAKAVTVDNSLDFHSTISTEKVDEPALEFKFEQSTQSEANQDTLSQAPLTFTLEEQPLAQPAHNPLPDFEFKLETVPQPQTIEETRLEEPPAVIAPPAQVEISLQTEPSRTVYVDPEDPIVQAFPVLTNLNPVDLDIDLAEQYIRLGEYRAAKLILGEQQTNVSDQQNVKIEQLLQKIA
ncbi:MAG: hypothetical protein LKF82_09185 [Acinetobacter populi]|jgi:hypothetical protein|uniref:hypothetical protein n=1 Tax=Acinetobacter populi TaxID=1582270 RepID=UPI002355BD0A|nr:hypothetical protein [Acinetobacter populi]MCH4247994.1 hypothetical protein [Acinetobacter populi]